MAKFCKCTTGEGARTELHDVLGLTGAEVSVNTLPAGGCVPFLHAHKQNEEIYFVTAGRGKAVLDGEEVALCAGDWLKVEPAVMRRFFAAPNCALSYICIQVKANSLQQYTIEDAVV